MDGVDGPRAALNGAVATAIGPHWPLLDRDDIAGRLLSADGVWAAAPAEVHSDARAAVERSVIAFLSAMRLQCQTRNSRASSDHSLAIVPHGGAVANAGSEDAPAGAGAAAAAAAAAVAAAGAGSADNDSASVALSESDWDAASLTSTEERELEGAADAALDEVQHGGDDDGGNLSGSDSDEDDGVG